MTAVRFHERHALQTVLDVVQARCIELGWGDVAISGSQTVNFGTAPFTYVKALPDVFGEPITQNTIAVTFGDPSEDEQYEVGAGVPTGGQFGLHLVEIPVFVDIFAEKAAISESVGSDIKAMLSRKHRYLTLKDYTSDSAGVETDELIEFDRVIGPEEPAAAGVGSDFRRAWRVVKAMANIYFNPEDPA